MGAVRVIHTHGPVEQSTPEVPKWLSRFNYGAARLLNGQRRIRFWLKAKSASNSIPTSTR